MKRILLTIAMILCFTPCAFGVDAFFVDSRAVGAADGSTFADAFTTITACEAAIDEAGDTCEISGGITGLTYVENVISNIEATEALPIIFFGSSEAGHNGLVTIDGRGAAAEGFELSQNYHQLRNVRVIGESTQHAVFTKNPRTGIEVSYVEALGAGDDGISVTQCLFCSVEYSYIHNNFGANSDGISLSNSRGVGNASYNVITNNNASGINIAIGTWNVFGNYIYNNTGNNVTISVGTNHNIYSNVTSGGDHQISVIGGTTGMEFFNNLLNGGVSSIIKISTIDEIIKIYNNVFPEILNNHLGVQCLESSDCQIYNNSFFLNATAGTAIGLIDNGANGSENADVRNNLISGAGGKILAVDPNSFAGSVFDYNLYDNDTAARIDGSDDFADWKTDCVAAGGTTETCDPNTIMKATDISLANTTDGVISLEPLASESNAIDKGTTIATVTDDVTGISRPQDSAYDIGAYEYIDHGGNLD